MREGHAILALACAFIAMVGRAAEAPPIEFSGVLTTNGKAKVALTDKATNTTQWLEPGEEFLGYAITRYDAKEEEVFLKKGVEEHKLSLVLPKTPDISGARPASTSMADAATTTAIRGNLRQFLAAARRFQLERGTSHVSFADVVGPDKYIKAMPSVAGENYSTLTYAPNVTALSVTTAGGNTVTLDAATPATATSAIAAVPAPAPAPPAAIPPPAPVPPLPSSTTAVATPASTSVAATNPPSASSPAPTTNPATEPAANSPSSAPSTENATPDTAAIPDAGDALSPTGSRYTTKLGDTLDGVARANGLTVEQLKALNPTVNVTGSSLPANQTIRIR